MRVWFAAIGLLAICGCGPSHDAWPLEVGNSWTYSARTGMAAFVESVEVSRTATVGDVEGFELTGNLGTSRVAWKGDRLLAGMLPNTRFHPPLPLLVVGVEMSVDKPYQTTWKGNVEWFGKARPGRATLSQVPEEIKIGSSKYEAVRSTIRLQVDGKDVELINWFVSGVGLMRQEQRTNGLLDVSLEYLKGS